MEPWLRKTCRNAVRIFAVAIAVSACAPRSATISGRAEVVDGDTFRIGAQSIRLWGIDAPEGNQPCFRSTGERWPCGDIAEQRLRQRLGDRRVVCRVVDRDRYDRFVSRCRARGKDVAAWMVENGLAVDYSEYSLGAYAAKEGKARAQRVGLWQGEFERPAEWRRRGRRASPEVAVQSLATLNEGADGGCRIKGNINSQGRRIFHVPGQRDYDATKIDPVKGEAWFCSAEEAMRAGWRAAAR